ncbi:MAG: fatty acid amide hydrolase [Bradymonadia bacterium]|jgi:fatty acid amide hydrolase
MAADAGLIFSYFGRYNVLGMPAGVVPTTRVEPEETWMVAGRDRVDARVAAISARSQGLPVAVQVVAPRWHDPTALAVMAAIETGSMPIEP